VPVNRAELISRLHLQSRQSDGHVDGGAASGVIRLLITQVVQLPEKKSWVEEIYFTGVFKFDC